MARPCIYFDLLDTARTAYSTKADEILRARQCIQLGQAELKLAVLCGQTPVFPQTYGWDSNALLIYAGQPGIEGACFRWLIQKGYIRIRLRDEMSLSDAAMKAFANPRYRWLSAWPEFNTDDPIGARRPLVEAMKSKSEICSIPEAAQHRLELLRQLSDALGKAPAAAFELPRGDKLRTSIEKVASVAHVAAPNIGKLLQSCTLLPESNNRTAIAAFLEEEEVRGVQQIPEAREIANACFNLVAANCVGATDIGLTTSPSQDALSVNILNQTFQGSRRADLFQGEGDALKADDLAELAPVSWEMVKSFVQDKEELSLKEMERQALAAKFIANIAIEQTPRHVMKTKLIDLLGHTGRSSALNLIAPLPLSVTTFVAGAMTMAGGWGAGAFAGAVASAIVAVGLAGVSTFDFGGKVKRELTQELEKKWSGLVVTRSAEQHSVAQAQLSSP